MTKQDLLNLGITLVTTDALLSEDKKLKNLSGNMCV